MNAILQHIKYIKSEIKSLCHKHGVKSLYVFGSVLTPRFTDKSDVDFLRGYQILYQPTAKANLAVVSCGSMIQSVLDLRKEWEKNGIYAKIIFVLGLIDNLYQLAEPDNDLVGKMYDKENLPKRVRYKKDEK